MAKGRKTGGRRLGSPNRATVEARAACAELVDDPDYRRSLARRLLLGKLSPALECMLWHYAKGKPKDDPPTHEPITIVVGWRDSDGQIWSPKGRSDSRAVPRRPTVGDG